MRFSEFHVKCDGCSSFVCLMSCYLVKMMVHQELELEDFRFHEHKSNESRFTRCCQICPRPPPDQPPPQTHTIHEREPPETERCDACQRRDPAQHTQTHNTEKHVQKSFRSTRLKLYIQPQKSFPSSVFLI